MSSYQAVQGYLASRAPDSRISLCELSTWQWFLNAVQKVILLFLAVKTQIFVVLDNLVHLLQTQSDVITLRAVQRMLVCTMFLEIWIFWIADTQLTAVVGALTFIILAVTLVFRFRYLLSSWSDLLNSSATSFFRPKIKFISYSVKSLESCWTIGWHVVKATKWLLLRAFPYLKNLK